LSTKRVITRRKVTIVPITQSVIDAVNSMAHADGMKGLIIKSRTGQVLFDSSWTAGVDYDISQENIDEDEDEDEEDSDDEMDHDHDSIDPNEEIANDEVNPVQQEPQEEEEINNEEQEILNEDDEEMEIVFEEDSAEEESEEENDEQPEIEEQTGVCRSTRVHQLPKYLQDYHIGTSSTQKSTTTMEYDVNEAKVIAMIMCQFNERMDIQKKIIHGTQHLVTYSLKKGIERFKEAGKESAKDEMKQLHDRTCFKPIKASSLNEMERKRTLESLIFMVQKKDGRIKSRHCANGSLQRNWMEREEVSSPTVSTESTLLTAVIEAEEQRDVATCDIPNAFIQTEVEDHDKDGNRTIMKIRGQLVDILCEIDPIYKEYVVYENGQKVLYVHITKAIYGLLVSAMLFYKKLMKDLQGYGFEINPYDPCVANKMVNGKQLTVSWHVDDLKSSHVKTKINDEFLQWIKDTYGSIGEVKITRGKVHEYLGMKLDYSIPGQVSVDMSDYVKSMLENFPQEELEGPTVTSPWNDNLFKVDEENPLLSKHKAEQYHTTVAQGLFLCKRARPDISPAVAYGTTRVRNPNQDDWKKLVRMMKFLKQTQRDCLTLRADGSHTLRWHVDAAFKVRPDFKSQAGATLTMGKGAITSNSRKPSMNTRSSTDTELVAVDEFVGPMLWTRRFLEWQGYPVKDNILYQDNKSSILLEKNGRKSAGKWSRHLNIRLFFITDQVEKKNISIEYCPTDDMVADYMTKPLQGQKFKKFRQQIMNLPTAAQLMSIGTTTIKRTS
jgi:hypothetical protein